jgi:enamine deaminase RidA (YjgF/YER057c/UK114 family)
VSAQLPLGGAVTSDSAVADQARQVLRNIVSIIEAAGGSAASVSKVTLYLTDIDDWDAVDNVFAEVFAAHRPARSVLQLAALRRGFRVSADAVGQRLQEFG